MPADSLLALSTRAAARLAPRITAIGDLPPRLALPILAKVASPAQLHEIEQSSPQIVGHIDDLWLAFLKRDVPNYESRPHRPSNPASWYKVYKKLKKQADADANAGRDALKAAMQGLKKDREATVAQFVDRREDLPRGQPGVGWRQQARFDYATGKTGSKGAHKLSLFEKIRKEKADARAARYNRPVEPSQGTMMAAANPAQSTTTESIIQERKRLEAEKRRERERTAAVTTATEQVRARRPTAAVRVTGSRDEIGYDLLADREARLKAIQSGKPSMNHRHTPPHSPPLASLSGQKRSADEAGLTIDDLESSYDDKDLIKKVKLRMDTPLPNAKSPLLPSTNPVNGAVERQASPSPAAGPVRIASPTVKPMAKKRAPPSLFSWSSYGQYFDEQDAQTSFRNEWAPDMDFMFSHSPSIHGEDDVNDNDASGAGQGVEQEPDQNPFPAHLVPSVIEIYEPAPFRHNDDGVDNDDSETYIPDMPLKGRFLRDKHPNMSEGEAEAAMELLEQILRYDPAERPSTTDLLRHPWIVEFCQVESDGPAKAIS
ncbi:hypothetical protein DV737_g1586, partial [Chaetothyriales sp. CBS 132003]